MISEVLKSAPPVEPFDSGNAALQCFRMCPSVQEKEREGQVKPSVGVKFKASSGERRPRVNKYLNSGDVWRVEEPERASDVRR
ncbi:hypothetical protein E2C01_033116 [Portunus trituberculatus]|uniref:Uncharacterized protein n=1 Tax=Portunus trituberculatus TaxID=210409 RepID=A0A5B7F4S8_PORTR|nr:hypothetical protein [Portunus trituberculatus]